MDGVEVASVIVMQFTDVFLIIKIIAHGMLWVVVKKSRVEFSDAILIYDLERHLAPQFLPERLLTPLERMTKFGGELAKYEQVRNWRV